MQPQTALKERPDCKEAPTPCGDVWKSAKTTSGARSAVTSGKILMLRFYVKNCNYQVQVDLYVRMYIATNVQGMQK